MYKMHVCMFVLKAYDVCNVIHNFSCLQDTADVKSGSQPSSYYSALCDVQASSGKVKDVFFFCVRKGKCPWNKGCLHYLHHFML